MSDCKQINIQDNHRGIPNDMLKTIWSNLSSREHKPVNFGKQLIRHFSPNDDPAFVDKVAIDLGQDDRK